MTLARRLASRVLLATGLFCCAACPANRTPVNVEFAATWEGQPLHCGESELSLTDLRFFVSEVVLIDTGGVGYPLVLTGDERWQQEGVALIDLENGEGNDAPLDDSAMHWHWRSGYKFLRAGVTTKSDGFWMHLGSTGCEGTVQNISGCRSPNRVTVELSGFSPDENRINIDLAALFKGVDLDDGNRSDCSSGPPESACARPFANLGLSFGSAQEKTTSGPVFQVGH